MFDSEEFPANLRVMVLGRGPLDDTEWIALEALIGPFVEVISLARSPEELLRHGNLETLRDGGGRKPIIVMPFSNGSPHPLERAAHNGEFRTLAFLAGAHGEAIPAEIRPDFPRISFRIVDLLKNEEPRTAG